MTDEAWRDWRVEHEGLVWRVALPRDSEGMLRLLERVEQRFGPVDRPDPFSPPVLVTIVAENELGEIVDGLYVELVAEIVKFSDSRRAFSAYPLLLPHIGALLQARKVRIAQMFVRTRWERVMRPALMKMGFVSSTATYRHWLRKVCK